jgi:protection-of-telomeres protein 1
MPPNGITAINDAKVGGTIVSLLGVIVSSNPPKRTRGTDWVLELTIQDEFTTGAIGSDATIKARLFRPGPDKFPKDFKVGDVALLRNFKLNEWNLRVDAVWIAQSGVLIFPASGIPIPALSQAYQVGTQNLPYTATFGTKDPTAQEQMAVIRLKQDASGTVQQVKQDAATQSAARPARDKLALIKDMVFDKFYDLRAQVVNIYYTNVGTVDLKVTDYTENSLLFRYVHPDDEDYVYQKMDWEGPFGQYTINVLLYGNNASWAREHAAVGEYVFLKNMHTKMSPANKLEGVLHDDRQRPNQIDIRKLMKGSDIDEINQRRKAYESTRKKKSAFEELQPAPNNPLAKSTMSRKAEKKARQRMQKEQEQKEIAEQAEKWEAKRSGNNLNS